MKHRKSIRKLFYGFFLFPLFSGFLAGRGIAQESGKEGVNLTVQVTGIEEARGIIQVGLYNRPEHFPKEHKQYLVVKRPVTGKTFRHTFTRLPEGAYAVALFQDLDENGRINKNFLGIPTEPYGFSNDVRPKFSAPPFERARFYLRSDHHHDPSVPLRGGTVNVPMPAVPSRAGAGLPGRGGGCRNRS